MWEPYVNILMAAMISWRHEYESVRRWLIGEFGYESFRSIQQEAFERFFA